MDVLEAIRRCEAIVERLYTDTLLALLAHANMEAANKIIPQRLKEKSPKSASSFNAIQQALAHKVAMDLARIFDFNAASRFPLEEQDKASIPVIRTILQRTDVQNNLMQRASNWPELTRGQNSTETKESIFDFIEITKEIFVSGTKQHTALVAVKNFRTNYLAHALFDKTQDTLPTYNDLNTLIETAKKATPIALLAVQGRNVNLEEIASQYYEDAEHYSQCIADGIEHREGLSDK